MREKNKKVSGFSMTYKSAAARASVQRYTIEISTSAESLAEFRQTIFSLPRITRPFNRACKQAVAIMDDLLNQLRITANQSKDVGFLLARFETTTKKSKPDDYHIHRMKLKEKNVTEFKLVTTLQLK